MSVEPHTPSSSISPLITYNVAFLIPCIGVIWLDSKLNFLEPEILLWMIMGVYLFIVMPATFSANKKRTDAFRVARDDPPEKPASKAAQKIIWWMIPCFLAFVILQSVYGRPTPLSTLQNVILYSYFAALFICWYLVDHYPKAAFRYVGAALGISISTFFISMSNLTDVEPWSVLLVLFIPAIVFHVINIIILKLPHVKSAMNKDEPDAHEVYKRDYAVWKARQDAKQVAKQAELDAQQAAAEHSRKEAERQAKLDADVAALKNVKASPRRPTEPLTAEEQALADELAKPYDRTRPRT